MNTTDLRDLLDRQTRALDGLGVEVQPATIEPAATSAQVRSVEEALGFELPPSFKEALMTTRYRVSSGIRSWPVRVRFASGLMSSPQVTALGAADR